MIWDRYPLQMLSAISAQCEMKWSIYRRHLSKPAITGLLKLLHNRLKLRQRGRREIWKAEKQLFAKQQSNRSKASPANTIVMVGVPRSGKSMLAQEIAKGSYTVVNLEDTFPTFLNECGPLGGPHWGDEHFAARVRLVLALVQRLVSRFPQHLLIETGYLVPANTDPKSVDEPVSRKTRQAADPEKALEEALDSLRRIRSRHPYRLLVVGPADVDAETREAALIAFRHSGACWTVRHFSDYEMRQYAEETIRTTHRLRSLCRRKGIEFISIDPRNFHKSLAQNANEVRADGMRQ